jgi:hypothetical protein
VSNNLPSNAFALTNKPVLLAAALIVLESLLIFAPMAILGAAIGWPASLDFPPDKVLPLILEHMPQVRLGYGIYLGYSLLFATVGAAVAWLAVRKARLSVGLVVTINLAVGLACASALARCIGIIRWLSASAELSALRHTGNAEPSVIDITQRAVNAWGGSIGENLGVSLFAASWLVIVSGLIVTQQSLPKWLGFSGFLVAIVVALQAAELFGAPLISVSLSSSALHIWLLMLGIVALREGIKEGRA